MLKVLNDLEKLTSSINNENVNYEKANILLMQVTETSPNGEYYYSRDELIKRINNYFNKLNKQG